MRQKSKRFSTYKERKFDMIERGNEQLYNNTSRNKKETEESHNEKKTMMSKFKYIRRACDLCTV